MMICIWKVVTLQVICSISFPWIIVSICSLQIGVTALNQYLSYSNSFLQFMNVNNHAIVIQN